jgi:hypothetical protein
MVSADATIGGMPRSRKSETPPKQPNRSPAYTVYARIDPALGAVLEKHIDSVRPKTTLTAVLELAIEEYLAKQGLWPPTDAE